MHKQIPPARCKSIENHVVYDDYFCTLATVLDLLRQDMGSGVKRAHKELLGHLRDDLIHLQEHYKIEPKR